MSDFAVPLGQRQLFLDDIGVERTDNLRKTLHQPDKKGAVIRSIDPAQAIQTRSAPLWDGERYRLYVSGIDQTLFESADGLHWTPGPQPDCPQAHVVYDASDCEYPYKAAILDRGFAASADGLRWQVLDVAAIQSFDEGNFSLYPHDRLFIHTVKRTGPYGRSVAVATSTDFAHWDDYGVVFHADDRDQELGRQTIAARLANPHLQQTEYDTPEHYSVQIYNMGVFRYEGLYIGLPSMYYHTGKVSPGWPGFAQLRLSPYIRECVDKHGDYTGFYNIQIACSRDLKAWTRVADRKPFIETSPLHAGAYNLQTLIGPSAAIVHGDELWFYYTGIKQYAFIKSGGEKGYDDYCADRGAICLAVLRRDGFVSLDADADGGTLTTEPFALPGGALRLNADAAGGEIRVEILDADDRVINASATMNADATRQRLDWYSGDLAARQGQTARLRFSLRNARLYSYWFAAQPRAIR